MIEGTISEGWEATCQICGEAFHVTRVNLVRFNPKGKGIMSQYFCQDCFALVKALGPEEAT